MEGALTAASILSRDEEHTRKETNEWGKGRCSQGENIRNTQYTVQGLGLGVKRKKREKTERDSSERGASRGLAFNRQLKRGTGQGTGYLVGGYTSQSTYV